LSIDFLERFGLELLELVKFLEEEGVPHRDIKPDNLGVGQVTNKGKLRLILFDFSLSHSALENIAVGTRPYLDPFLSQRPIRRWDVHAERFAAAMTLHEMATGVRPVWGDGQSLPELIDVEVTLDPGRFAPSLRDGMVGFFRKALARDYRKRFDTVEEMLGAWRKLFQHVDQPELESSHGALERDEVLKTATLSTPLILLGLSTRATNAIERVNVHTVQDFLRYPLRRLHRMRGVGSKTTRELIDLFHALRTRFAVGEDPVTTTLRTTDSEVEQPGAPLSVESIAKRLALAISRRGAEERSILESFLGLDGSPETGLAWLSQTDLAKDRNVSRQRIGQAITKGRDSWQRNPTLTVVRQSIAEILHANGGIMTHLEMLRAVSTAVGSTLEDPQRSLVASVVTRACIEAELAEATPRFGEHRRGEFIFVACTPALCDYARALGKAADGLAAEEPIPSTVRCIETLRTVALPERLPPEIVPLVDGRLLQFAASLSKQAAVSIGRLEIYPRGLDPIRALRQIQNALFGPKALTVASIRDHLRARYPEAGALPDRPELDRFLREVRPDLYWSDEAQAYLSSQSGTVTFNTSARSQTIELGNHRPPVFALDEQPRIALDRRLKHAAERGGFLAITALRKHYQTAERLLVQRFGVERCDLDTVFLEAMAAEAAKANVNWQKVLEADAAPRESADWRRLMILLDRCMPAVEAALAAPGEKRLFVNPGLLARYQRMPILTRLSEKSGRPGGPHALWLLVPDEGQAMPMVDGEEVPVISTNEYLTLLSEWVEAVPTR